MIKKLAPRSILIASPELRDPHFKNAVVLILEHDEEGTVGLILNRESNVPCEEIAAQFDLPWPSSQEKLLMGGPVDPRSLWILHADGWSFEHTHLFDGVSVSRSEDALTGLCLGEEEHIRIYVGYSGWGTGQLQREMEDGAWWVSEATSDLIFQVDINEIWSEALKSLGIDPTLLMSSSTEVH